MTTQPEYTRKLTAILATFMETQNDALNRVAEACAKARAEGRLLHLFGSGHSVIPTLEAFPRYGSFVGLHPLTDPRLMWHNVLAPGGVRELLWLERTEGYIDKFLNHEPLSEGDVLVVYSHSGKNAAGIEAAQYAKARGLVVVAVTALSSLDSPGSHSSGQRLTDVADIIVDTCVPVEDAIIDVEGWDRPLGGSSTVVASIVSHEIITRTGSLLAAQGIKIPVFVSPTVAGATVESNNEVFAEHAKLIHAAQTRWLEVLDPISL